MSATCTEVQEVHNLDYGTRFQMQITECVSGTTTPLDLSTATDLRLLFSKPDGSTLDKVASLVNPPGTDGWIEYVAIAGDIDQVGAWTIQGLVTFPTGEWHSEISSFQVYKNIID